MPGRCIELPIRTVRRAERWLAFSFALTLAFTLALTLAFAFTLALSLALALQHNGIEKLNTGCEGKIVEIDGKKYKLTAV